MDEAGGFAEAFITAYDALVLQGRPRRGRAPPGLGRERRSGFAPRSRSGVYVGAHVTAVTRTRAPRRHCATSGADEVISLEDVVSIVPVDVVLELVGAAHLTLAQSRLAPFRARS